MSLASLPPPPPPPMIQTNGQHTISNRTMSTPPPPRPPPSKFPNNNNNDSRSNLLQDIQKGVKLKRCVNPNDRSEYTSRSVTVSLPFFRYFFSTVINQRLSNIWGLTGVLSFNFWQLKRNVIAFQKSVILLDVLYPLVQCII